jgi:hypothetical protein
LGGFRTLYWQLGRLRRDRSLDNRFAFSKENRP